MDLSDERRQAELCREALEPIFSKMREGAGDVDVHTLRSWVLTIGGTLPFLGHLEAKVTGLERQAMAEAERARAEGYRALIRSGASPRRAEVECRMDEKYIAALAEHAQIGTVRRDFQALRVDAGEALNAVKIAKKMEKQEMSDGGI